jgi:hypothetical protein
MMGIKSPGARFTHEALRKLEVCFQQIHDHQPINHVGKRPVQVEPQKFAVQFKVVFDKCGDPFLVLFYSETSMEIPSMASFSMIANGALPLMTLLILTGCFGLTRGAKRASRLWFFKNATMRFLDMVW